MASSNPLPWLTALLIPLLEKLSPVIREMIGDFIKDLYQKALATDSPWDDFFVGMVAAVLDIDVGSPAEEEDPNKMAGVPPH